MYIVLAKDVPNLGRKGEIKDVKRGYAVNFLLPTGQAEVATIKKVKEAAKFMEALKTKLQEIRSQASDIKDRFDDMILEFAMKANKKGHLYGSVSERDVLDKLHTDHGIELTVHNIKMDHVREIGERQVAIHLAEGVETKITINVIPA